MIIKPVFGGKDWCVEWKCPCLTCEFWINGNPECTCKPCNKIGLLQPQDVICHKTHPEIYRRKPKEKNNGR